ncbi:MAG: endonuclease I [Flavobacteriales bacterium 32-35-8]|nr:MAG: endonuclease I [Flavobacteriales bacterium 32-35-8]
MMFYMKNFTLILIASLILIGCSNPENEHSTPQDPNPIEDGKPIAVDDVATVKEDDELVLENLLSNDTVLDNAKIKSFDTTTTNGGTVTDNRNGTYTYKPTEGFVGDDSFSYSLCDDDETPNCSSATVSITVIDEGDPIANADAISSLENTTISITNILANDEVIDGATIESINNSLTIGTVVLNNDKTITYTPQNGFLGDDSFTYTLCDDDTPESSCSTATVTISVVKALSFNIPSELASYYSGISFSDISSIMFDNLRSLTTSKHTTILSYGQRHQYLYNADEDPNNPDNVILMYSGESRYWKEYTSGTNSYSPQTFNTEHIYPQSLLSSVDAVTDLHHLRTSDTDVNSLRSNFPYTNGSGTYALLGNTKWYPGDDWRGDVARMVMYLNIRYGEIFSKVGTVELFLEWNILDPVSEFEIQRNNVIEGAQGNRNPFIDNPYLATLIWGGNPAENKWN